MFQVTFTDDVSSTGEWSESGSSESGSGKGCKDESKECGQGKECNKLMSVPKNPGLLRSVIAFVIFGEDTFQKISKNSKTMKLLILLNGDTGQNAVLVQITVISVSFSS